MKQRLYHYYHRLHLKRRVIRVKQRLIRLLVILLPLAQTGFQHLLNQLHQPHLLKSFFIYLKAYFLNLISQLIFAFHDIFDHRHILVNPKKWPGLKRNQRLQHSLALTGLCLLILLSPLAVYLARHPRHAEAAWLPGGWLYRQKVSITNTGSTLTDYQVGIPINTASLIAAGQLQSNCADFRLTDQNAMVISDKFYVENCNTTATKIWVKFASLPNPGTILYFYYGNSTAASTAVAGDQVFDFFDDFNDNSLDTNKWTKSESAGLTVNEINGEIRFGGTSNIAGWQYSGIATAQTFTLPYIAEVKAKLVTVPAGGEYRTFFRQDTASAIMHFYGNSPSQKDIFCYDNGGETSCLTGISLDTWYDFKIVGTGSVYQYYVNGTYYKQKTSSINSTISLQDSVHDSGRGHDARFDNIRVRKYAATEPTVTLGTAEQYPAGPAAQWKFDEGYTKPISNPITKNEQQISLVNSRHSTNSNSFYPTDNSLGIIHWDADQYSGATVYFETAMKKNSTACGGYNVAALFTAAGSEVAASEVHSGGCDNSYVILRSPAITLTDDTDYTVRFRTNDSGNDVTTLYYARLIIVQNGTSITSTETQIEVGAIESQSNNTAAELTNKKIYTYDATQFTPTPTAYFEASLKGSQPIIEQQINLINGQYTTSSTSFFPTDNSLGIIHWDADQYPGATVYFETAMKKNSTYCGGFNAAAIFTTAGSEVASSEVTTGACNDAYNIMRSGALTLTDDTDYTVRFRTNSSGDISTLYYARLVIQQTNPTKITGTETQIDLGAAETQSSDTAAPLTNKRLYLYDSSKFTPTPTAYFEASLKAPQPIIEQQINISNQYSTTTSGSYVPTDNSLGLIHWDADKYPGATVYFETVFNVTNGCCSNGYVALFNASGTQVTNSEIAFGDNTYANKRSASITLTDDTDYTVRIKTQSSGNPIRLKSARLVIIQTNATKITGTETQIEVGSSQTAFTNTTAAELTNPKYYLYDASKFSPHAETAGDVSFSTTLKIDNSADTVYAELYNKTDGTIVATASHTGNTNWSLATVTDIDANAGWDAANPDDYVVRVYCADGGADGCSGNIANAKIIMDQADGNGITALEVIHSYINTPSTDADATYHSQNFMNLFNPFSYSTSPTVYFETTMKTSAGTGYAQLINTTNNVVIGGSVVTTTSAAYERKRTGNIAANLPLYPQLTAKQIDTQLKNGASDTTTASNSWLVIQISNLATSPITAYADLYNVTDSTPVADSEVSVTSNSWSRPRTSALTLTTGKEYVVRTKSSASDALIYIANSKLILDQADANGITAFETMQQQVNSPKTDGDITYSGQNTVNRYNPGIDPIQNSFTGASLAYFYETTMKTSAGTGYARLLNYSDSAAIIGGEVTTTSNTYERKRTGDITAALPQYPQDSAKYLDTQIRNGASDTTTVDNSWLVVQVSNLTTTGAAAYADLYNITDNTPVVGSEVSVTSASWARQRSAALALTTGKEYVVRTKSSIPNVPVYLANAKLILNQQDEAGIKAIETFRTMVTGVSQSNSGSYGDSDYINPYDPANVTYISNYNTAALYFEATLKTSAGTGYTQLKNDTDNTAIAASEITTTSTVYERKRSSDLGNNLPSVVKNLDTQLRNGASDTTSVSTSQLIVQNNNTLPNGAHDSTVNANMGNVIGAAWKSGTDCVTGSCLAFDGANDFVKVRDANTLDFAAPDSFTAIAWFKSPKATAVQIILAKYLSTTGTDGGYKLYMNANGTVSGAIDDDNTWTPDDVVTSIKAYDDDVWHQAALVKTGTSSLVLYIDGIEVNRDSSITATGTLANTDNLFIGIDGNGISAPWKGFLDTITLYPTVRTAAEIKVDYTNTATAFMGAKSQPSLTNGLVSYWKLDETSTPSLDSTGNENHAAWNGNTTAAAGKFGNAISFDGDHDQTVIASPANIPYLPGPIRKPITVTNSSGSPLTNYQVLLTISYDSDMQADFDDLRFTNAAGTPLNYFVENKTNGITANVWVKVDLIPASGSSTIYMYYGDSTVSSFSSVSSTFTVDSIYHFTGTCTGSNCNPMDNHTEADAIRQSNPPSSTNTVTSINDTTGGNDFFRRYRYLFVPNSTGTYNFGANSDDASDVAIFPADGYGGGYNTTHPFGAHTVVASWYGSHGTGTCGSSGTPGSAALTSGTGVWLDYMFVENSSGQQAQMCIKNPGGSYQIVSTANFPGQLFSRSYTSGAEPTVSFGSEQPLNTFPKFPITLSAWVKADTLDNNQRLILSRGSSPAFDWYVGASATNSGKLVYSLDGNAHSGTSTTTLSTGLWYFVTLTSDTTKTKLYVNGQPDSETVNSGYLPGTSAISLGAAANGTEGWDGLIDEVRIYNRSLSPGEVADLYGSTTSPQLYYSFDEGTGTTSVYDRSGHDHTGTLNGSMTNGNWLDGKYGKALSFDGINDTISVATTVANIKTVSFWVKPATTTQPLVALNGSTYLTASAGTLTAAGFTAPVIYVNSVKDGTLTANAWNYVTVTTNTGITASTITLGFANGSYLNGALDDFKLYDYVNSATGITADFNAGHPAPGSPVGSAIIHYQFDETSGTTAHNIGNGGVSLNGNITGATWNNAGKVGHALSFNGISDYLQSADTVNLTGTNQITTSFWLKWDAYANDDDLALESSADYNGNAGAIMIDPNSAGGTFDVSIHGVGYRSEAIARPSAGVWHHYVVIYNAATADGDIDIYVDGQKMNSTITLNTLGGPFTFGNYTWNVMSRNGSSLFGGGQMDEFKLFNFALTEDQINVEYNQGKSAVMGNLSTAADGKTPSNSTDRLYCPPGDTTPTCAPVAEWNFEENTGTTVKDTSGNGSNGTLTNSGWSSGKHGSAMTLNNNGNQDVVTIIDPPSGILDFSDSQDFTYGVWFKGTHSEGSTQLINKGYSDSGTQPGYVLYFSEGGGAGGISCNIGDGTHTNDANNLGPGVNDGRWHYLTCVLDRDGSELGNPGLYLFVDDVQMGSNTSITTGSVANNSDITIGEEDIDSEMTDGKIDEVKIYNYARTPAQIAWDYSHGQPILYYAFDECNGTTLHNLAPAGGYNATIYPQASGNTSAGSCSSGSTTEMWNNGAAGKHGYSLDFDGLDDYASAGNVALVDGSSEMSACAWIKYAPASVTGDGVIMGEYAGANQGWTMWVDDTGAAFGHTDTMAFTVSPQSAASGRVEGQNGIITSGTWDHYCGVFKGGAYIRLYKNGQLNSENTTAIVNTVDTTSEPLLIGRWNLDPGRYFDGQLDDLKIFNYALTDTQVQTVYNSGAVSFTQ